jgi:hypothetical protein
VHKGYQEKSLFGITKTTHTDLSHITLSSRFKYPTQFKLILYDLGESHIAQDYYNRGLIYVFVAMPHHGGRRLL